MRRLVFNVYIEMGLDLIFFWDNFDVFDVFFGCLYDI